MTCLWDDLYLRFVYFLVSSCFVCCCFKPLSYQVCFYSIHGAGFLSFDASFFLFLFHSFFFDTTHLRVFACLIVLIPRCSCFAEGRLQGQVLSKWKDEARRRLADEATAAAGGRGGGSTGGGEGGARGGPSFVAPPAMDVVAILNQLLVKDQEISSLKAEVGGCG